MKRSASVTPLSYTLEETKMRILLIASIFIFLTAPCSADEYYEFYSIHCIPELDVLNIETFGAYNIDKNKLSEFENKYNTYEYGQTYGYSAEKPMICNLPPYKINMYPEKNGPMNINILKSGKMIYEMKLYQRASLMYQAGQLKICKYELATDRTIFSDHSISCKSINFWNINK